MNTIKLMPIVAVLLLVATLLTGIVSAQDWLEESEWKIFPEGYFETTPEAWEKTMPWSDKPGYWDTTFEAWKKTMPPWSHWSPEVKFNESERLPQPTSEFGTSAIPFPIVMLPMIYLCNITVDAITPDNVGHNATIGVFTSAVVIDNETYYGITISKPDSIAKMYLVKDDLNEDYVMKRAVTEIAPGEEQTNLTFNPAFVFHDFTLWVGKTWTDTSNVTGTVVNQTGAVILVNTTASVVGKVTEDTVTVPLGTFPCMVLEDTISYEINGNRISTSEKYWETQIDDLIFIPKYQMWHNGALIEELEAISFIPPLLLSAADNNTTINVTAGRFLVIALETPTTGYTWEVVEPSDAQVLRQLRDIEDMQESVFTGTPSSQIATFEVVGPGEVTITMFYHQPLEDDVSPADTFTVRVIAS